MNQKKTKKIALRGMLIAVAFVLSWLEAQIPAFVAVPGVKLGLTNLVVLIALYRLGTADAFLLNGVRILLAAFTFGNLFSFLYSLAGGMLSTLLMVFLKKTGRFGIPAVSMAGGIAHNVGQVLVAMLVLESTGVAYYLGVLWFSGIAAGALVGFLGTGVLRRLPENLDA